MSLGLFHAAPHSEMLRFRVHPFLHPQPFSFQNASENAHFETKMHQISLRFETHPKKRKSLKIPINKDFSGKKEDVDIVLISESFGG